MVFRMVLRKRLPRYLNHVHVRQQNITAEWPLAVFVRRCHGFTDLSFLSDIPFQTLPILLCKVFFSPLKFFHLILQKSSIKFVETNTFLHNSKKTAALSRCSKNSEWYWFTKPFPLMRWGSRPQFLECACSWCISASEGIHYAGLQLLWANAVT